MRSCSSLLIALLAAAPPASAQTPPAQQGWHLGGGVDALRFGHVLVSDAAPDVAAELLPSGRAAFHLAVGRTAGPWTVSLEAGWAEGTIEAGNEFVSVRDLTSNVTRYRLALPVGRRVAGVGTGTLRFELAPTLDLWSVSGDSRFGVGAEGRLALRMPLGDVDLEHRIGLGLSASPLDRADVGEIAEQRALRTLLIGLGLRTRL